MVTVHKPPFAAGRAVSLQIRGAAERCEVSWNSVKQQAEEQLSVLGKSRLLIVDVSLRLEPVP
ncbi:rCG58565, isoform CRA_b [Rattus norvegicus]|uniref:RCG58565, isoform CRA_b n=1 Tax=Rattus norvegicus TaxID=10116 RepID=A6K6Z5_RAT|nr:rCG58565, isoform CRA_b [Rattus norvegicus]